MKYLFILSMICCSLLVSGQEKIKFGKISMAELTKERSTIDESAPAEVLAEYGNVTISIGDGGGFSNIYEYHKRIKIYNNDGYSYADITLPPYYKGNEIESIRGWVYNLVDGKVEKIKLTNSMIITEKFYENWRLKKITFPKVKAGTVIEYKFVHSRPGGIGVPDWTFQEDIPVVWSEYTTRIPEWFNFRALGQGNLTYDVYETNYDTDSAPAVTDKTWVSKRTTWAVKNAAPLKDESFISSKENYLSKLNFQFYAYQLPGDIYRQIGNTYGRYNKQLMEETSLGGMMAEGTFLQATTDRVAIGDTDREKAIALYQFIQDSVRFNGYYSRYPGELEEAWNKKEGSVATVNFLLMLMLRQAGLTAEPIILSTRKNGFLHPTYVDRNKFNYMITAVKLDDKWVLLDATDGNLPFGRLSEKCFNQQGWIISNENQGWISLQDGRTKGNHSQATLNLDENGIFSGTMQMSAKGYQDTDNRVNIKTNGTDDFVATVEEGYNGWQVNNVKLANMENIDVPLMTSFDLQNDEHEDSDYIYLDPVINPPFTTNPFQKEKRVMPVDFPYGRNERFYMTINLPENYVVDELPKPTIFKLPERAAQFQFSATLIGNRLTVINNLKINKLLYTVEEYEGLKKFFEMMINKQQEQIVLKRI